MCLGLAVRADTFVNLAAAADADIAQEFPGTNYGGNDNLKAANVTDKFRKAYVLFDASNLVIEDVVSVSFYYSREKTRTFGVWILWRNDGQDNNWTELGITWNNAPYNDGTPGRAFNARGYLGENAQDMGSMSLSATDTNRYYEFVIPQAAKARILNELTTGDRKVTLGVSCDSGSGKDLQFWSKENSSGLYPPILRVKTGDFYCATPLLSDVTGDCRVNIEDLALMALDWMKCNRVPESECLQL